MVDRRAGRWCSIGSVSDQLVGFGTVEPTDENAQVKKVVEAK